ncbi:MAG TPA: dual specificity protein phosphatase family protein [Thermodesulfobacteriota bacterium]|nr:dual specificity protein phosphatase family protein [Thermodesulfobacteriota bacterium]
MPERFSWVIEDALAGMERPGLFEPLDEDLLFLRDKGIDVIVNLEEEKYVQDYPGFIVKRIPVNDFKPPRPEDYASFMEFMLAQAAGKKKVVVHCYAGMGRTNLMIAAYLMNLMKIDPVTALNVVKLKRPFHVVTWEQEESLKTYFDTIRESLDIKEPL